MNVCSCNVCDRLHEMRQLFAVGELVAHRSELLESVTRAAPRRFSVRTA